MIVRILHEGQFDVDGLHLDQLNSIDNQIVEAIADQELKQFERLMQAMHDLVYEHGKRVPAETIVESDIILPPSDASMDEVRDMFTGEGLIPG